MDNHISNNTQFKFNNITRTRNYYNWQTIIHNIDNEEKIQKLSFLLKKHQQNIHLWWWLWSIWRLRRFLSSDVANNRFANLSLSVFFVARFRRAATNITMFYSKSVCNEQHSSRSLTIGYSKLFLKKYTNLVVFEWLKVNLLLIVDFGSMIFPLHISFHFF
jgi:hypothetical protein